MEAPKYSSLPDRFWSKVQENTETGCWEWQAALSPKGYGQWITTKGTRRSHRISFIDAKGKIPKGKLVLHHCDVPGCVNPEHLYYGTHQDNMNDAIKRERWTRGVIQGSAKLNDDKVRKIRVLHATGDYTPASLADRFKVSQRTIRGVVKREWWRHVE